MKCITLSYTYGPTYSIQHQILTGRLSSLSVLFIIFLIKYRFTDLLHNVVDKHHVPKFACTLYHLTYYSTPHVASPRTSMFNLGKQVRVERYNIIIIYYKYIYIEFGTIWTHRLLVEY